MRGCRLVGAVGWKGVVRLGRCECRWWEWEVGDPVERGGEVTHRVLVERGRLEV